MTVEFKKYLKILFFQLSLFVAVGQSAHILHHISDEISSTQKETVHHDFKNCDLCVFHFNQITPEHSDDLINIPPTFHAYKENIVAYTFHNSTDLQLAQNLRAPPFIV